MTPPARTWAKSRTRRSIRLAMRGVPRLRRAISMAPSSSMGTSRMPAAARDDAGELLRGVELQPQGDAEAVPQGGGELPGPGGGPDEGEAGQVQPDGVGRGALADDDVDGEVLHGRVQNLLHLPVEAVDLVHKEDVVLLQVGQQGRQVPRLLDGGAGGDADVDPHLVGDDAAKGGLAQAGRAVEQHMVQGLPPHLGRLDKDLQVSLGLLLADVVSQGLWAQSALVLVLPGQGGGDQGLLGLKAGIGKIDAQVLTS